ncbi:MAG: OadG family protein [Prevotella sp.]|nr:OadG family protein [Prevotella sp.]MDY4038072.1 OadG family protein [Prevotella sp.]
MYDANCTDLIDSVTVPSLAPDMSYARIAVDGGTWVIRSREKVTPGIDNSFKTAESKISKWKREDPHGLALSFLSMGIVFSCLALLYVFFRLSGTYMEQKMRIKAATEKHPSLMALQKAGQIMADTGHKTNVILKDGLKTKGIDKEIYVALIAMELKEYLEDVHDVESDIITIKGKHTNWNNLTR